MQIIVLLLDPRLIALILALILLVFVVANTIGFITGAPYAPTPSGKIKDLLKALNLGKNDTVVDLGSGDGRLLVEVSKTGAKAVGFEINPFLYLLTKFRLNGSKNAKVSLADFWNQDLKAATVIFVFILPQFMKGLEKKLREEVKPGTKVVTYLANLPTKKPFKSINGFNIYKF